MNGRLQGRVATPTPRLGPIRVAALDAAGAVLAEAWADEGGRWHLSPAGPAEWVLAQLTGTGIAAALAPVAAAAGLRLPELLATRVEIEAPPPNTRIWLDPVALDGFPDGFLPALRSHAGGVADLHLAHFEAGAAEISVLLQPGRYRLGGGVFALRPWEVGHALAEVVDLRTMRALPRDGDAVLLDADGGPLRVAFRSQEAGTP
jgi:hypothetical protein